MEVTLVYPNQLFTPNPAVSRKRKVFLVEDPLFFGDLQYSLTFHKKKILLHKLSMINYQKSLIGKKYSVDIIQYKNLLKKNYTDWMIQDYDISGLHVVDVVDDVLSKRIKNAARRNKVPIKWYNNPSFLLDYSDIKQEFKNKSFHFMATFYKKQRRRFDILVDNDGNPIGGKWSYDDMNRKKIPKNLRIPKSSSINYDKEELKDANNFITEHFSDNYGTTDNFNYPVNNSQARESMVEFFNKKFELFGPYEDAILNSHSKLFHSILSPSMNIGLITPKQVLEESLLHAEEHSIPINSLEGFVRQILGWREFIRGIYVASGRRQRTKNYWNFDKVLPNAFYNGSTGILPVDQTIKKVMDNAYLHHIERLMIMGNIFVLLRFDPDHVYRWFMELFIDAYDWVMVPNVYGMSQFSDGGLMSTKPYISGSNYILKMSDYPKSEWTGIWDALYWEYINDYRWFFRKNPRMSMMVSMYDKKPSNVKNNYKNTLKLIQF